MIHLSKAQGRWLWVVGVFALGCGSHEPHPGSEAGSAGMEAGGTEPGGSAGAESGGSESGGSESGGSAGVESGGSESGGASGAGFGGSWGGDGVLPSCPPEPAGGRGGAGPWGNSGAGSGGISGAGSGGISSTWPDGFACSSSSLYCRATDGRNCTCFLGKWLCYSPPVHAHSLEEALTGAYRGRDNQACLNCAEAQCHEQRWPCEGSDIPGECLDLLACQLESGCPLAEGGVKSCYCGDAELKSACVYTNDADGVCLDQESAPVRGAWAVLPHYFESRFASGQSNQLAQCLAQNCGVCFGPDEHNACPIVSALSVDNGVALGSTGQLSVLASDPDHEPSALQYAWSVKPASGGSIADPASANTTFSCASAGTMRVSLRVSDGDPNCVWETSRTVSCNQCDFGPVLASARAAFLGDSITLSVAPRGSLPLEIVWSAPESEIGTLIGNPSGTATYTCLSPGVMTITADVAQGSCSRRLSIPLTCTMKDAPNAQVPDSTESALKRQYVGQNNQECWSCAQASPCLDPQATPCELRTDPAERALCLRLLQCELESGCASSPLTSSLSRCYCKTSDGCFTEGACNAPIDAALQITGATPVLNAWNDSALPGGQADILVECLAQSGCTSCVPPENQCPVITSLSAVPDTAAIGEAITLSLEASDPDGGPQPLSIYWAWSNADDSFRGSIADPTQPQATFICEAAGIGQVAAIAYDGNCNDTKILPLTCVE